MKKIFVVIPNWNGADMIAECLQSLEKQTCKHQVVVVDNGSVDESVSLIESQFPDVHLIRLPENTGFTGGVNTGIQYALEQKADAVALFNNDAVADKNWLKQLATIMETQPDAGIVTCKLMRDDKKHIDSTGDYYTVWGMPFPRGRNRPDKGQYEEMMEVFGASGGASLYRVEMLAQIGLFDQHYFAYFEDVDISFRAQLAGWKVIYQPKALAFHQVSATSSKLGSFSRYHSIKNFYMTYTKNMPGWLFWKYLPKFSLMAFMFAGSSLLKHGGWAYTKGTLRAFSLLPHTLRERWHIQRNRKVSTGYIDSQLVKERPPRVPKIN